MDGDNYTPQPSEITSGMQDWFENQYNPLHQQTKREKYMIISLHAERTAEKSYTHSWLKTLSKLGIKGNFLNLI